MISNGNYIFGPRYLVTIKTGLVWYYMKAYITSFHLYIICISPWSLRWYPLLV